MLRDYQKKIIEHVRESWKTGHKRPCIVAPCGSGKTVIASELAKKATDNKRRVLFIVHRRELAEQTENTFKKYGVDMYYCKVGMVQTLCRRDLEPPNLIIVDENHHVYANSYVSILDRFQQSFVVGLTATPQRLDGSGLGRINDDLILGPTVSELIELKHLAPFKYYSHLSADTSDLHTRAGEFIQSEMDALMGQEYIYGNAVENYKKYGCNKTIVYCSSIKNSTETAKAFKVNGILAVHVDGETPKLKRDEIMEDFRAGRIKVLCNVDLVSEGFDVPDCDSCILLRPTQSLTLHIQQSMRSMRYMPGKTATIIDMVENYKRHGLPDTEREWTLEYKKRKKKEETKTRMCQNCYSIHKLHVKFCNCGFDMRSATCIECEEKQQYGFGYCFDCGGRLECGGGRLECEVVDSELTQINSVVLHSNWRNCQSVKELQAIQKDRGYKPGWVWYKSKELGLIAR